MELIQLPKAMRNRGFIGWPQVYRVSASEPTPPVGVPYIIAEEIDFALVFRIMVPTLMKQHPYFDWSEIYESLTGVPYIEQRVYIDVAETDSEGSLHSHTTEGTEPTSLYELAADNATYVDLDMLTELGMIPSFMQDIREAIKINVTNSYMWTDGYNKKTGICSGSLVEQPRPRNLIILDISMSIPDGVSAGMMTLVKTMTDVANADLILTGGKSYSYTHEEVRSMDIHAERERIPRSNESFMFKEILLTHDMNYENIITFGDSDTPWLDDFKLKTNTKRWYSFFAMDRDRYGSSYKNGVGYGRWIKDASPGVQVIHNTKWARFFKKSAKQGR